MNTPSSINIYVFALTISKQDIASVIAGCSYALQKSISLVDSLEKLGFDVDTSLIQDVSSASDLTYLVSLCIGRLIVEKSYESVIEPLPMGKPVSLKVGDKIWHQQFPISFLALIDDRQFKKTGNSNDLWLEIKMASGSYSGMYAVGRLKTLESLGWRFPDTTP